MKKKKKNLWLCSVWRNDLREKEERKILEGLEYEVGVVSFKIFGGNFRMKLLKVCD